MARSRVPDAGDIVWISFDPQTGHEQAGHRPAVVLSPAVYNAKTSLMVCCPMTTQIKNYPFEVVIAGASPSAVLADQVKSLDWRAWPGFTIQSICEIHVCSNFPIVVPTLTTWPFSNWLRFCQELYPIIVRI